MAPPEDAVRVRILEIAGIVLMWAVAGGCSRGPDATQVGETLSALTNVETPEQAAVRKLRERTQRLAAMDDLKARMAQMPDSPARRDREQQLRATFEDYMQGIEGLASSGNTDAIPVPPKRTPEQRASLLGKISQYDLKKTSGAAEWARVKAQELGQ
jgi:hypothetical protein